MADRLPLLSFYFEHKYEQLQRPFLRNQGLSEREYAVLQLSGRDNKYVALASPSQSFTPHGSAESLPDGVSDRMFGNVSLNCC